MIINSLNIENKIAIRYTHIPDLLIDFDNELLSLNEKKILEGFKNIKRKNQFIAERIIINNTMGTEYKGVEYNVKGKPYLINSTQFISISHTNNLVAVAFANQNIGLDIEEPRESLLKVKNRFLNEEELLRFNPFTLEKLSFLWNLKEASLKFHGISTIDYQQCIQIKQCDFSEKAIVQLNLGEENISLKSSLKKIDSHTLAVVYNDYNC